ncbi:MAG TPA: M64 family metallopeptidase [Vicinamibacterales bacterium]|nr:M64 family metallopeptidase [Vicinamibacterales bacterium]
MVRTITALALVLTAALNAQPPQRPPAPSPVEPAGTPTVVPVSVNGDPAARFSLVVMSDGYTAADMPKYRAHLDKHLNVLWSIEPFRSYRNYINVYSVEIPSPDSGITCDPATREQRKTPLAAHFQGGCSNSNARGILVNQEAARAFAKLATPQFDQILVLTNTDTYGGIGGGVATTSGGNALGVLITPHELGHSLGRLQDEYTYRERGLAGGSFGGSEPNSVHHTLLTEEQMRAGQKKWFRWLGDESESGGKIGRFEGGQYMTTGIWRPSKHSMMISIGYYFDQVSRERMVQRVSEQVNLIADARPTDTPVGVNEVLWIEAAHPNYHELDIMWSLDGKELPSQKNLSHWNVNAMELPDIGKPHTFTVTVTDPTAFVRDPAIRTGALTATRTWTLGTATTPDAPAKAVFTGSTQTQRPVSGREVVYVTTTHPVRRSLNVTWRLGGTVVKTAATSRTLSLTNLPSGTHTLTATVSDPLDPRAEGERRTWTIDNTMPSVNYTLSTPVERKSESDGTPHYVFDEEFTMKLEPTDDQKGYVVAEFRVDGDGWHHYYGWPDAPAGTPFKFTPRGTTIKELVYGSLSSEGLSPQPWEERKPGYGTHRIEYRAIDAAGNIGPARAFLVTVRQSK